MVELDNLSDESRSAVEALLRQGQKIAAIKRVRAETGVGLKEAKQAVESFMAARGIETPRGSSGCALVCALLSLGLALVLLA